MAAGQIVGKMDTQKLLNVPLYARAAGYHSGKGPLNWARTFAPDTVTFAAKGKVPIPMYASLRLWRLLNLAVGQNADGTDRFSVLLDPLEYPFSVKTGKKLNKQDVFNMHGDLYKGTEFELGRGVAKLWV